MQHKKRKKKKRPMGPWAFSFVSSGFRGNLNLIKLFFWLKIFFFFLIFNFFNFFFIKLLTCIFVLVYFFTVFKKKKKSATRWTIQLLYMVFHFVSVSGQGSYLFFLKPDQKTFIHLKTWSPSTQPHGQEVESPPSKKYPQR